MYLWGLIMNWAVIGDEDQLNPTSEKNPEDCGPCQPGYLNPVFWPEKFLTVSGADHLKFFILTYAGNPQTEEVVVTVNAPYDDANLILGALILFQQRTSVPVRFQEGAGITFYKAGAATTYGVNSVVGLVSTEVDGWAFSGDFGFD